MTVDAIALDPAPGIRIVWDLGSVRELAPGGAEAPRSLWTLEGSLEDGFAGLRVLSGATDDGTAVLLAGVRPTRASGHGEELTAAAVVGADGPQAVEEALLSTEYAPDGSPRRITLELWQAGEDYPFRGAGEATAVANQAEDERGVGRTGAALRLRFDGREGAAVYEIVRLP